MSDWTDSVGDMISAYIKSKTLAELDLWVMAKNHPDLSVSTVNPGFILGPVLDPQDAGTSCDVILKMMRGDYPGVPKLGYPTVDVRDVVDLHFRARRRVQVFGHSRHPAIPRHGPGHLHTRKQAGKWAPANCPTGSFASSPSFEPTTGHPRGDSATARSGPSDCMAGTPRTPNSAAVATADSLIALGYSADSSLRELPSQRRNCPVIR